MKATHTIGPNALEHVCPALTDAQAKVLARAIGTALHRFEPGIGTYASAYFVGQVAHETGEFRWLREIWDGKGAQASYWKRRDLQGPGPLYPGLGKLARGGGMIQTTGRINYRAAAKRLKMRSWAKLARHSGEPAYAAALAAIWWADHFPADMSHGWDTERVTRVVNGGTNGLAERRKYTVRAMGVRQFLNPEPI